MRLTMIVADPQGDSHFVDTEVQWLSMGRLEFAEYRQAQGALLRRFPADFHGDWHCADVVEVSTMLSGEAEYEVSDGEKRRFGVGSVLVLSDTHGKGHRSRNLGKEERVALVVVCTT